MDYVLIVRDGFKEQMHENRLNLEKLTDDELVDAYNRQATIGIVGVYQQAVYLASMRSVFLERFNESPIRIEDGNILKLKGLVELKNHELSSAVDLTTK
jgi:hypothetical protein